MYDICSGKQCIHDAYDVCRYHYKLGYVDLRKYYPGVADLLSYIPSSWPKHFDARTQNCGLNDCLIVTSVCRVRTHIAEADKNGGDSESTNELARILESYITYVYLYSTADRVG